MRRVLTEDFLIPLDVLSLSFPTDLLAEDEFRPEMKKNILCCLDLLTKQTIVKLQL